MPGSCARRLYQRDRDRQRDADRDRGEKRDNGDSGVERDLRPERQPAGAEHIEQADPGGARAEPEGPPASVSSIVSTTTSPTT